MKLTPSFLHAMAVDPVPQNGPNINKSGLRPLSLMHISGSLTGKIVGWSPRSDLYRVV